MLTSKKKYEACYFRSNIADLEKITLPVDVNINFVLHLGVNETVSNVQVSFHNITWDTQEVGSNSRHDPSINFLCSFDPSDDDTVLYHIDWYVDNDTVIQGQTVNKYSLQDAILSARDMNNAGKKINSWVGYFF